MGYSQIAFSEHLISQQMYKKGEGSHKNPRLVSILLFSMLLASGLATVQYVRSSDEEVQLIELSNLFNKFGYVVSDY